MMARPVSRRALASSFKPFEPEALEFVRRGARLEGAAAQDGGAGGFDRMGGGEQLLLALDRARSGHDLQLFAADQVAPHIDGGIGRVRLAADEFVALLHRHDALDLRASCSAGFPASDGCVRRQSRR